MNKKALITGITGQDGSYLAEFLLERGYEVYGLVRRAAIEDIKHKMWRINHILKDIHICFGSLENYASLYQTVLKIKPDECYHLASHSFVSYSFEDEFSIFNTNINGTHYILSCIKEICPDCKFYFAGSSEMFGKADQTPQNEDTRFHPRSTYGISKVAGYHLTCNYREQYDLFAANGILFNHESPRRGYEFVTRKISSHVAQIKLGKIKKLPLGNIDAVRDWGHAKEYVRAMWKMLNYKKPVDLVISSGEIHSVREFVEIAFSYVGLNYKDYVFVDPQYIRPSDKNVLQGDCFKAEKIINWNYQISFNDLVEEMVENDLVSAKNNIK